MAQPATIRSDSGIDWNEIAALARCDFATFVELMFPVLHSNQPLMWADYIGVITAVLEECTKGNLRRVIVNLPPGYLKSMLISVLYPAWRLGLDPSTRFICISYGDDLAHHLSTRVRDLMLSQRYRSLFPGTVLVKKSEDFLTTTKGGYRYATSIGSDITGFRANEIIIDDPLQPEDAYSGTRKEAAINWIRSSALSCFLDPAAGVLITVMHRLAPDDPAGLLEETADFVLKLPLIADEDEEFEHCGKIIFKRKAGTPLHPGRITLKDVEALKQEIPPHVFNSQYQQRPTMAGSGMCSIERLARYKKAPPFELIIHSWDFGITKDGNYTVCTKWGVAKDTDIGDVLYLIDVVRIRVEAPDVRKAVMMHDRLDKPDFVIIDGAGIGLGIYQDLQARGYRHVIPFADVSNEAHKGKVERFGCAVLHMYDGKIRFPNSAPYLESLFNEFAAFPEGKYDDQVDSVTQIVCSMPYALDRARQKLRPVNLT